MGNSYAYNCVGYMEAGGLAGLKLSRVKNPSITILVADGIIGHTPSTPQYIRWHNKDAPWGNVLFVDGHVEYILVKPSPSGDNWTFIP